MSAREVVMLGTASQAPTRDRNHNATLLRWDGHAVLFDPGEGTQRQFARAGLSVASVNRICISHFHGDHCLGLPGVILRLALDNGHLPIPIHYPASGERYFQRLCGASAGQEDLDVQAMPIIDSGVIHRDAAFTIRCARLSHRIETFGFRLEEPDGRWFLPERLQALGLEGAAIGRLRRDGTIVHEGRMIRFEEVSEPRRGQVIAYVMDTAWCDAALELAAGADLVVCESTFLSRDEDLAAEYGHLTARQAGRLAREAGARRLVLGHFSRRYDHEPEAFGEEARSEFDDVVVASDLDRIPVPDRR
jgi:ribonuclease Z